MLIPFRGFSADAPAGAVIGIVGEGGEALANQRIAEARYLGPQARLDFAPVKLLIIDHALARADALARAQAAVALNRLRSGRSTILLFSQEPALLRELCDEIWWIDEGKLAARGDPRQVLDAYQARVSERFRAWGESQKPPVAPALRKGDGRAEIIALEIVGSNGQPTSILHSGELAIVNVVLQFKQPVENPVIGIMIRTRIGLEVYGTNTELEKVVAGPCAAGETIRVRFAFRCELCPKDYTLTAASHDPDGTAHDWLEDAVAFSVTDIRYTAGVANLHATATVERAL